MHAYTLIEWTEKRKNLSTNLGPSLCKSAAN